MGQQWATIVPCLYKAKSYAKPKTAEASMQVYLLSTENIKTLSQLKLTNAKCGATLWQVQCYHGTFTNFPTLCYYTTILVLRWWRSDSKNGGNAQH